MKYNESSALKQSQPSQKRRAPATFERRCICAGCLQHTRRLEEFNALLARANDTLRRECDDLRRQLDEREAA